MLVILISLRLIIEHEMMEKTKAGITTINSQLSSVAKKAEVGKKASGLLALMYTLGQRVERLIFWIISFYIFW